MARIFVYDDREFPDPAPAMTVDQVKATLSDFFGEIANASVTETARGADTIYEFQRRVGTKGAPSPAALGPAAALDPQSLAALLSSVPPTRLRIIELQAELIQPDGSLDLDAAARRQPKVELACSEAQEYARSTKRMLEALRCRLQPRRS